MLFIGLSFLNLFSPHLSKSFFLPPFIIIVPISKVRLPVGVEKADRAFPGHGHGRRGDGGHKPAAQVRGPQLPLEP
jgi:hypothetical protein